MGKMWRAVETLEPRGLKPGFTSPLKPRLHAQARRGCRRGRGLEADTQRAMLNTNATVERRAEKRVFAKAWAGSMVIA
jgi:hypothetical protein